MKIVFQTLLMMIIANIYIDWFIKSFERRLGEEGEEMQNNGRNACQGSFLFVFMLM